MRAFPFFLAALLVAACSGETPEVSEPAGPKPSILLVTLDTTRADAIGPGTPAFNALAARGLRFQSAYATAPQTLPSHASMMTGLYPAGHGVHENARYLSSSHPLIAARLREAGYRTAAFVSAFPLARQFGLGRGFETYDDALPRGSSERSSRETTDRALAWLAQQTTEPLFVWVHYFDPHYPYEPSYPAEVTAMDRQLGRLVAAFEKRTDGAAIIVVADHGEGLGDHGEEQHGNLLYQATMHVPLVVAAPGVRSGVASQPVSTRRIFHTIAALAGLGDELSLTRQTNEVVAGEAMKPFLQYGWQPQVMAIDGARKVIHAGRLEVYDLAADPAEQRDLGPGAEISRETRKTLLEYPIPQPGAASSGDDLSDEDRRRLASLGYVSSGARPMIRDNAPRPADMSQLFPLLDRASGLFVAGEYAAVIPLLERILEADPHNVDAALRLAVAHSGLGHEALALAAFDRAAAIAPESRDVRHYRAMHLAQSREWQRAAPILERIVAEEPDRVPALEALAVIRERQRRPAEALELRLKIETMKTPAAADLIRMGELAMAVGNTDVALRSFEKARQILGADFRHDLELGVLYIAARRFEEARQTLDRVPRQHPGYPMALFKRAQVSVLLGEPDRAARIDAARRAADATTRELIAREQLFR
ncbi:MAG TPA: sulfatase-like hydrolase/transferase [Thermoanaerobaculia bacterium]|nr:sulfatase-like hydrolase/transferase [Thermoanaerobaculia bacterium]